MSCPESRLFVTCLALSTTGRGKQIFYDRKTTHAQTGMILGWYDKYADKTFKREGSFFGNGDQTERILGEFRKS